MIQIVIKYTFRTENKFAPNLAAAKHWVGRNLNKFPKSLRKIGFVSLDTGEELYAYVFR